MVLIYTTEENFSSDEYLKKVTQAVLKAQMEAAVFGMTNIVPELPKDLGLLRASVHADIDEARVQTSITMLGYVLAEEFGLPIGYTPEQGVEALVPVLAEWVIRKSKTFSQTTAEHIARSIIGSWWEEGRPGVGMLGYTFPGTIPDDSPYANEYLTALPGGLVDEIFKEYDKLASKYILEIQ